MGDHVPNFDVDARGKAVETIGAPVGTVVMPAREVEVVTRPSSARIHAPRVEPTFVMPESSTAVEHHASTDLQSLLEASL